VAIVLALPPADLIGLAKTRHQHRRRTADLKMWCRGRRLLSKYSPAPARRIPVIPSRRLKRDARVKGRLRNFPAAGYRPSAVFGPGGRTSPSHRMRKETRRAADWSETRCPAKQIRDSCGAKLPRPKSPALITQTNATHAEAAGGVRRNISADRAVIGRRRVAEEHLPAVGTRAAEAHYAQPRGCPRASTEFAGRSSFLVSVFQAPH